MSISNQLLELFAVSAESGVVCKLLATSGYHKDWASPIVVTADLDLESPAIILTQLPDLISVNGTSVTQLAERHVMNVVERIEGGKFGKYASDGVDFDEWLGRIRWFEHYVLDGEETLHEFSIEWIHGRNAMLAQNSWKSVNKDDLPLSLIGLV